MSYLGYRSYDNEDTISWYAHGSIYGTILGMGKLDNLKNQLVDSVIYCTLLFK